jgi:hypothetical protein
MSFGCFSCQKKKEKDSIFFSSSSLENEAKYIGERTQVTLDDQIYISLEKKKEKF